MLSSLPTRGIRESFHPLYMFETRRENSFHTQGNVCLTPAKEPGNTPPLTTTAPTLLMQESLLDPLLEVDANGSIFSFYNFPATQPRELNTANATVTQLTGTRLRLRSGDENK